MLQVLEPSWIAEVTTQVKHVAQLGTVLLARKRNTRWETY